MSSMAFDTASNSRGRVFWRSSHSSSVMEHFSSGFFLEAPPEASRASTWRKAPRQVGAEGQPAGQQPVGVGHRAHQLPAVEAPGREGADARVHPALVGQQRVLHAHGEQAVKHGDVQALGLCLLAGQHHRGNDDPDHELALHVGEHHVGRHGGAARPAASGRWHQAVGGKKRPSTVWCQRPHAGARPVGRPLALPTSGARGWGAGLRKRRTATTSLRSTSRSY